jgi:Mrp family chromosome partitioning ATPase
LLDSAPLLPVSDGIVLSNKVDAMLIVVRATTVKRPVLAELQRVLSSCPAAKLGFVLTGSDEGEGYGYGYGYAGYGSAAPAQARPVQADAPDTDPSANGAENAPGRRQSPSKSR